MALILLIVLVAFLITFTWLSARDIKSGIYSVIFFMPFYLVRFSVGGIPTTALEMMIYILFVLWFLKNKKSLHAREDLKNFYKNDNILAWGITLLFLGTFLSTMYSADFRTSLGVFKGWFFDPLIFLIIFVSEIKNRKEITDLIWSLVLSGFAVALIGIGYALIGSLTFDGRLRSFYESPNYLAMYISPALLFAVYIFAYEKNISFIKGLFLNKWARFIILLSFVFVLSLTKSYGAVLGVAVALFCFLLKKYQSKSIRFFSVNKKTFTVLVIAALAFFSFLTFQKYEQIVNAGGRSSLSSRFMIWDASRAMLKDSPIFGIGPGTFQGMYLEYQSRFATPYLEWAVPQPHNTLLAFYLQTGLVGFVGFLLILFWLLKRAKTDDIVFLFLVYFLVHGCVDTLYWKNDLAMIFWLLIGIANMNKKN